MTTSLIYYDIEDVANSEAYVLELPFEDNESGATNRRAIFWEMNFEQVWIVTHVIEFITVLDNEKLWWTELDTQVHQVDITGAPTGKKRGYQRVFVPNAEAARSVWLTKHLNELMSNHGRITLGQMPFHRPDLFAPEEGGE